MTITDLATLLRALQFFAHNAHHLACGPSFLADHEFLGEIYAAHEGAYDSVIELILGDGGQPDLLAIQSSAVGILSDMTAREPGEGAMLLLLKGEQQLQQCIDRIAEVTMDQGIIQTIGTIAEASKVRSYKLSRRLLPC